VESSSDAKRVSGGSELCARELKRKWCRGKVAGGDMRSGAAAREEREHVQRKPELHGARDPSSTLGPAHRHLSSLTSLNHDHVLLFARSLHHTILPRSIIHGEVATPREKWMHIHPTTFFTTCRLSCCLAYTPSMSSNPCLLSTTSCQAKRAPQLAARFPALPATGHTNCSRNF
jgi:hypothetical protein